jgi:hypothetical protein
MKGFVPPDPYTDVSGYHYAIVYVPRKTRNRFPKSCVEVVDSAEAAIEGASEADKKYAARVIGPSKSSEGQYIYYLDQWLE